ncbi:MAG: methyltransferase domain-containing protein [Candidatus Omnitrophota bacterium]
MCLNYKNAEESGATKYLKKHVLRHLQACSGLKILEIGCGNGFLTNYLRQQGHKVLGIDISESAIQIAKQSHPESDFLCLSAEQDLSSTIKDKFDAIIAVEVMEHLYAPKEMLKNVKKLLKDQSSVFIFTVPYYGYLKNLLLALFNKFDKAFVALWDGGHIKFFHRRH